MSGKGAFIHCHVSATKGIQGISSIQSGAPSESSEHRSRCQRIAYLCMVRFSHNFDLLETLGRLFCIPSVAWEMNLRILLQKVLLKRLNKILENSDPRFLNYSTCCDERSLCRAPLEPLELVANILSSYSYDGPI